MKTSKNPSIIIFEKIFNNKYSVKEIRSEKFLEILYSHEFKSLDELSNALHAYERVVLTKPVLYAIHVDILGEPSIAQLTTQYKIREGMEMRHTVEEYEYDGPMKYPKWYRKAFEIISVPNQEQSSSQL